MNTDKITGKTGTARQILDEEWKDGEQYLKAELDNTILSCDSTEKEEIQKAYTIRNGKRPWEKFKYLSEAYGVKFPAKIRHIPVLKSMFDAIAAIDQSTPLDFRVTCRDVESINLGEDELKKELVGEFVRMAREQLESSAEFYESGKRGENPAPPDKMSEEKVKKILQEKYTNFKSSIEIGGQDLLESVIQKLEMEIMSSLMVEDLMASGSEYFQVKPTEKGKKPIVRVLNPREVFFRKDPNKKFLRDHNRVLLKEKVNLQDLLMNYGHRMKPKDIKRLLTDYNINLDSGNKFWNLRDMSYTGIRKGLEKVSYEELFDSEVTLYYGEWIANTEIEYEDSRLEGMEIKKTKKRKYRKDRYEGFRVNEDVYFGLQKSDFIYRPSDDPYNCFLTVDGASYNDRNGEPYSLVLNTEDIADKIDVLHYIWESMVAMSGNKAALINYRAIPTWLGKSQHDRVRKWIGMVKQGAGILDLAQPGAKDFANSGQLDFSIDASIGVITEMIKYLEEVAGNITGVSRQMRGSITPQDLKGTTQMALNQSSMVLMPFFFTHNSVMKRLLTATVNAYRLVNENGFTGSYVHGDLQQKVFSINNEKFWLADLDVWLSNSGDEQKSIEELKALSIELVKANQIDAVSAVDMNTIKSLTRIKESLKKSLRLKEENMVDQLSQEMQGLQEELQKVTTELEKVDAAKLRMQERDMQLREMETKATISLKDRELTDKSAYENKKIELEKKRVELEALQLSYGDKSKEVRNS